MIGSRLIQLFALMMIGDGVAGFLKPRWHSLLWDAGPKPFRKAMELLAANREQARVLYALEIAAGSWLASRQTPEQQRAQ
jgi:hypothetical protein